MILPVAMAEPEVPETELLIKLMLAVDVLLTGAALLIPLLLGEGGGLLALVLGLQGDAGGDVFGGVGGISSWPEIRLGRLDNLSDDFRIILELVGVCGGFSVTKGLEISSGSSSSSWDSISSSSSSSSRSSSSSCSS